MLWRNSCAPAPGKRERRSAPAFWMPLRQTSRIGPRCSTAPQRRRPEGCRGRAAHMELFFQHFSNKKTCSYVQLLAAMCRKSEAEADAMQLLAGTGISVQQVRSDFESCAFNRTLPPLRCRFATKRGLRYGNGRGKSTARTLTKRSLASDAADCHIVPRCWRAPGRGPVRRSGFRHGG